MDTYTDIETKAVLARRSIVLRNIWKHKALLIMLVPAVTYYFIFKFIPLLWCIIAFQNYNIFKGFLHSPWVGFLHFQEIFSTPDFLQIFWNNLVISFYAIVFNFPAPIILALLLNEIRNTFYKRTIQTLVYLPHFISWSIIAGLAYILLSSQTGIVNGLLINMGLIREPIAFLQNASYSRGIIVVSGIWKETGWSAIVYLATLSIINPSLYESAKMDGAGRFRQCLNVTIPGLAPAIITLLLLRIGNILDLSFEQVYPFVNGLTMHKVQVIDTYAYSLGVLQTQYSMTTAVGLFKSVIGFTLLLATNKITKRISGEGIL